jgi:tyrosyl-tRNA synthetase
MSTDNSEMKRFPSSHYEEEIPNRDHDESRLRVQRIVDSGEFDTLSDVLYEEMLLRRKEDLRDLPAEAQAEKLIGRSKVVLPESELYTRLQESKDTDTPLKIKYGIDPTGPFVHLGHAVPIILLDRLQRMGHDVTIIVGDFTTAIGDPSGRTDSRPILTDEQIRKNFETYADQINGIIDIDKATVVRNSEWLDKISLKDLLATGSKIQLSKLLQREDFRKRLDAGHGITQTEVLYPIVMGMDSVFLKPDIELGGQDQLLNMQMCRTVMEVHGQRPEIVISTGLVLGTTGTGEKMSKSLNNYIALTDGATEVYGRTMSIPDTMMVDYYKMFTEIEDSELTAVLEKLHPLQAKKLLAKTLTSIVTTPEDALAAADAFDTHYSKRNYENSVNGNVASSLGGHALVMAIGEHRGESFSAVRRLFANGGINVITADGDKLVARNEDDLEDLVQSNESAYIKAGRNVVLAIAHSSPENN